MAIFLGVFGAHCFYTGKKATGTLYLLTAGSAGIGWIVGVILVAAGLLSETRSYARESGLLNSEVLPCGENSFFICPWRGTKEIRTITKLLSCGLKEKLKICSVADSYYYLQVTSELSINEFLSHCRSLSIDPSEPNMVLPQRQTPKIDKYDPMVPENLLRSAYLYNQMDLPAAVDILRDIGRATHS